MCMVQCSYATEWVIPNLLDTGPMMQSHPCTWSSFGIGDDIASLGWYENRLRRSCMCTWHNVHMPPNGPFQTFLILAQWCNIFLGHAALQEQGMLLHHWAYMKQVKKHVHMCMVQCSYATEWVIPNFPDTGTVVQHLPWTQGSFGIGVDVASLDRYENRLRSSCMCPWHNVHMPPNG